LADDKNRGDAPEREISRPSLADAIDLLDLVRSSEDAARISTSDPPQLSKPAPQPQITPAPAEEFVDVGDEAVEVAPSLPPMRLDATQKKLRSTSATVRRPEPPKPEEPPKATLPPALSIGLIVGLAVGVLYLLLALPPINGP
jgi:hypothetical protein